MSSDNDFHQLLVSMLNGVTTENPLEYTHTMYDSISPAMVTKAIHAAKEVMKKEVNKQGNN